MMGGFLKFRGTPQDFCEIYRRNLVVGQNRRPIIVKIGQNYLHLTWVSEETTPHLIWHSIGCWSLYIRWFALVLLPRKENL